MTVTMTGVASFHIDMFLVLELNDDFVINKTFGANKKIT